MRRTLAFGAFLLFVQLTFGQSISSPSGRLSLTFFLSPQGIPYYTLRFKGKEVILPSRLGLELKDQPSFLENFTVIRTDTASADETWEPVWGEVRKIRNSYRELRLTLQQRLEQPRTLVLTFRLYDDGLGFRYEFPQQPHLTYFILSDERTEFALTANHTAFWIPGDFDTNEYVYNKTPLSDIDALSAGKSAGEIFTRNPIGKRAVQTPLLMKTTEGLFLVLFEAALVDYPAMCLTLSEREYTFTSTLAPDAVGNKAYLQTPTRTPWRVILVSDRAIEIASSKTILNLNEPCRLNDVSWIKPQKYVGIWWEMHVGRASWSYADTNSVRLTDTDWRQLKPNGRHGATTERTKQYIDFAARHGFDAVLIEGWNVGWEDWFGKWKEEVFDFVTPYPDFDLDAVQKYAAKKGIELIMHHETASAVTNYERRIDEAFRFMKRYGYKTVKTGYVGRIIPRGEWHDGQWMINHYLRVVEKAAQHRILVNSHESVRPTGLHRTYPNWIAAEAARGNEFNAWSRGNPPEHETILPFTRLLGGPMDYTPGIFQIKLDYYHPEKKEQVHTTLAKQLALYVTLYSPLQMAADLPENYERFLDAFQFIKDVAVDWEDSRYLEAEPGDYLTVARKAKGRNEEWFIGAITDENARLITVRLDFLQPERTYTATLYLDAPDAHWEKNPMAYRIEQYLVNYQTALKLSLAPGGGAAVSIRPATAIEEKRLRTY
ncbi:MAG: glycoside hydrolase family 97 protein [Saprospiraceae bacterium]|nr:glycoside hydrolase family 97 protein [Saprospiraceae bacterium]MDW8483931.1 glycoside hydrolase family 97 protein [Saprospiraceae bacterium]